MDNLISTPEILFDDDISFRIKKILKDADKTSDVFIVSPYVKLDTRIKEAFEEAYEKNVRVTMLIRSDADHPLEDINWLIKHRVILKQVEKLHAKIYIGNSVGLVASMNMHSFSGQESKEAGVLFQDEASIKILKDKVNKWLQQSKDVDTIGVTSRPAPIERHTPRGLDADPRLSSTKSGHCIRCGASKSFNPKYPLCDSCYKEWAKYKNEDYVEKFCHRCGNKHGSSVAKPLCKTCWSVSNT